jgi:hypothetical protein
MLEHFLLAPRSLRDDLLRGRFDEAIGKLTAAMEQVSAQKAVGRSVADIDRKMGQWLEDAVEAQAQAMRQTTPAEQGAAKRRLDELWLGDLNQPNDGANLPQARQISGNQLPIWLVWLLGQTADPLGAEASYLLALCKHEQAERAQATSARSFPEQIQDAWRTADGCWSQFLEDYPNAATVPTAQRCKARTLEALGDRAAARQHMLNFTGASPLEQTARMFLAKSRLGD